MAQKTVEQRLQELEDHRDRASGRINALQQMVLSLVFNGLAGANNPTAALESLRKRWLDHPNATDEYRLIVNAMCDQLGEMRQRYQRQKN